MKRFSFVLLHLLFFSTVWGRESERIAIESRFVPYRNVENSRGISIQPEYAKVRVGLPPVMFPERKGFLATSVSYENLHFNYRNWGDESRVDTVHGIQLAFFYGEPMKKPHWSRRMFLTTGLSSDFASLSLEAFRAQGGIIFERDKDNRKWGLGIVVIDNFGRTLPYPAITYEALYAGRHRVSLRAPTQGSWFYVPGEKWEAGVNLRVDGGSYRLEEPGDFHGKTLRYSVGTVGPELRVKLKSFLLLSLESGWMFRHKIGIYSNRNKGRGWDLENSYYVTAGLRLMR